MSFKIGDRVRVLQNSTLASHPLKSRRVIPGDIITISGVDEDGGEPLVLFDDYEGVEDYLYATDVELAPTGCSCDVMDLILGASCVCGFLEPE